MWKVVIGTAAFTIPASVTLFDLCGYVAKVEGCSMQPALNPPDWKMSDYVLLNRWGIRQYNFQRGEIVCLTCPSNPGQKIIKRIIGLEGDTIKTPGYRSRLVTVPQGHCWVEGDHHGLSLDSNVFGPVALGLINARASYVVWPPRRWQRLAPTDVEDRLSRKHMRKTCGQNSFAAISTNDEDDDGEVENLALNSDVNCSKPKNLLSVKG